MMVLIYALKAFTFIIILTVFTIYLCFYAIASDCLNYLYYGIFLKLNIINLQMSIKYKLLITMCVVKN